MTVHPVHRRISPAKVFLERSFPWRTALSPLSLFVKEILASRPHIPPLQALSNTWISINHCYPRHNDIIWATSQRSGHNWLAMTYTIIVEAVFNQRQISLEQVREYRPHVYRHMRVRFDMEDHLTDFYYHLPIPRLLHTHNFYFPFYRNRRVLIQLRHPRDVLISHYYHGGYFQHLTFTEYLRHNTVRRRVEFFNTWGRALNEVAESYCLRYEDLRAQPGETIKGVLKYFKFPDVEDAVIQRALNETSLEKVKAWELSQRGIDDERELHFARAGTSNQDRELTDDEQAQLNMLLTKDLKYSFGYEL